MLDAKDGFALKITKENSEMNFLRQESTEGSMLLNNQSFLAIQIHHDIKMIISMKNGTASFCLAVVSNLFYCLAIQKLLGEMPPFSSCSYAIVQKLLWLVVIYVEL